MRSRGLVFPGPVAVVLLALVLLSPTIGQARSGELASGALGLTRPEIEEQWGVGVGPFAGPGPYFTIYEMFSYSSQRGTYHVGYQDTNGQEIAVYLEINLPGGLSEDDARALTAGYLPDDAEQTEAYTAPPSPDGALALQIYRYQSPALDTAYRGILAGEILVIFYEQWDDPDFQFGRRVTAVSMIVRTITQ